MDIHKILSDEYNIIFAGLVDLSRIVRGYATHLPTKLQAMEAIYLNNIPGYSEVERKQIIYFREAFSYKFHLVNLHLEQLWSLDHMGNHPSLFKEVLSNIYDAHQFSHDNLLLPSFAIEGFILQGTAFLDFYMLYMCSIFRISETNYLSGKKFLNALKHIENELFKTKAEQVKNYFAEKVFGGSETGALLTDNWGELLKNLRHSLVHRDKLIPDFQNNVPLLTRLIDDWPERENDLTCSRFCQDVQNVMFYLLTNIAAVVYGLEYKPGPYEPGMW